MTAPAAHGNDPVVVGVDGSEQATTAVRWATREAARRGTTLLAVHAWVWPLYRISLEPPPGAPPGELPPGLDGDPQSGSGVDGEAELADDAFGGVAADRVGGEAPGEGEDVHDGSFHDGFRRWEGARRWHLEPLIARLLGGCCVVVLDPCRRVGRRQAAGSTVTFRPSCSSW